VHCGYKIVVKTLSSNFREATEIASIPIHPLRRGQILVRIVYVGINASDINYTAGKYLPGEKPPFDAGMEGLGVIAAAGEDVSLRVGDAVTFMAFGSFAEYVIVSAKAIIPVPSCDPAVLSLLVSGLTASIALEQLGNLKKGKVVLVTAAAGGTGVFAVQLAKLAGCHVIGTCSNNTKIELLKSLGCDRVVNYKAESLHDVLKSEYPKGIDVVYESVGAEMFETCVKHLAVKGRLIVIGWIAGYQDQSAWGSASKQPARSSAPLPVRLLANSACVCGFFLNHFVDLWKPHMHRLMQLVEQGILKPVVDPTPFHGLEDVPKAIDHMYAGRNVGKVVVRISDPPISSVLPSRL